MTLMIRDAIARSIANSAAREITQDDMGDPFLPDDGANEIARDLIADLDTAGLAVVKPLTGEAARVQLIMSLVNSGRWTRADAERVAPQLMAGLDGLGLRLHRSA
ncbi:hypothetical protein M0638_28315 [Roseomonas sp. NAR14]|uniref:Uncharacterized protein n=1 Tax=Roseomonas acroporae TaxID=2937791 RepID=A0A9X1YEK0_9PROT|nr:hypothetical protein [Roseomonas acroporae]MCK8788260.1 hypothetical protein [Roseomonas acroporae]